MLLLACDTKPSNQQARVNESSIEQSQYPFFNNKLLINSPLKPEEETGEEHNVSPITIAATASVKKYFLKGVAPGAHIGLTIMETKKDTLLPTDNYLIELIKLYKNMYADADFAEPQISENHLFSGFETKGKATLKGKGLLLYLNIMTDKKIMIISVGIYSRESDFPAISRVVNSIKRTS